MADLSVDQMLSGATLGLTSGLTDLLVLETGGRRVLYGLSRTENTLVELEVAPDGSLSFVDALVLTGTYAVGVSPTLAGVTTAGTPRIAIGGLPETSGQSVSLGGTGGLGLQAAMAGLGTLVAPLGLDLGGSAALISGRPGAGGMDLFTDQAGQTWVAGLDDTVDRYLADVSDSADYVVSGTHYVATASAGEDGINIVTASTSSLSQAGAIGVAEGLPINTPEALAIVQRLGETQILVAASGTSSLSSLRILSDGTPVLADHILDADWTQFQGASALDSAVFGDFAFVAVGGAEGGVSLFSLLPGGRLVHLDSMADDASTSLYRLSSLEVEIAGDSLQIYGASAWEAGVTRLSYDLSGLGAVSLADGTGSPVVGTGGDDQLIGSSVAEALSAGGGDDILLDGAGSDTLTGGPGDDLFVFSADGVPDEITDFERGQDRLDLSSFDFLYDVSQLLITPTATGAVLSHNAETINLTTSDGAPLTAGELTNADILNVDRPPLLATGQELLGGAGPDTLNGGAGPDTISGAAGDDAIFGSFGNDSLIGGAGFDLLEGGGGMDTIHGHSEDDTLRGGLGDDLLFGDGGHDVIYGDDIA